MKHGSQGYTAVVLSSPPGTSPANVTLVEESELVVCGVRAMLAPYRDINVVPVRSRERGSVADIVLYDPTRPGAGDRRLAQAHASGWVYYTWDPTPRLVQLATAGGVRGVLSKRLVAEELASALLRVHRGEFVVERGIVPLADDGAAAALTPREREVIAHITAGLSNQEIADDMALSINSIKSYIRSAYRKMEVESRSQAVLWGVQHGWAPPERSAAPAIEPAGPGRLIVARGGYAAATATSA
jgi:DNA-binding NarL/FixJ family response regulator